MKKILFLILAFLILICSQSYAANRYGCTALTGGGTGALDALDITASGAPNSDNLADGDSAIVTVISGTTVTVYEYIFDADGTDAENSPNVIRPDDYSSGGVWRLVKIHEDMIPDNVAKLDQTETITANWVNTANPWADNEVADDLTISSSGSIANGALDVDLQALATPDTWSIFYSNGTENIVALNLGAAGTYLKSNGPSAAPTWETPTGSGDVTGPSSSTDNAIARFDGTGGKTIQNSNVTVDDTGNLNLPSGAVYQINGTQISTQNLSDGSTLGSATNIGITSGDNYTNFGTATDDSINELFAAIDASWPSGSGAPTDAEYVTLSTNATLSAERVLTEGTALDITDGGAGGNVTIAFDPTEITDTTWGVNTDTSQVWTWDTGTGTDPSLTITDDAFTFNKKVVASGIETSGSSSGPQLVWFLEDSDNGSNYVGWGSPASNNNDLIFLLPTSDPSANQILGFAAPSSVTFSDGTARDATQASWLSFGSDFSISGGTILIANGVIDATASATVMKTDGCTVNLGNGSDAITTGTKWTRAFKVPFKHDLTSITVTTNETSGSITIDVWKDSAGATNGLANITDADSLFDTASEPNISDASSDNTVEVTSFDSGEATDIAADTWYVINVDSASTLTFVAVSFEFTRKD